MISEEVIERDLMMIESFNRMIIQFKDAKSDLTQALCMLLVIKAIFQACRYNFMKFNLSIKYSAFCHDSSLVRLSLLVLSDLFSLRHLN